MNIHTCGILRTLACNCRQQGVQRLQEVTIPVILSSDRLGLAPSRTETIILSTVPLPLPSEVPSAFSPGGKFSCYEILEVAFLTTSDNSRSLSVKQMYFETVK